MVNLEVNVILHPTSEDTLKSLSETFINSINVVTNVFTLMEVYCSFSTIASDTLIKTTKDGHEHWSTQITRSISNMSHLKK